MAHSTQTDGDRSIRECPQCNGSGSVTGAVKPVNGTVQPTQEPCSLCAGSGRVTERSQSQLEQSVLGE